MSVELTSGRNVLGGPLRACAFDPLTGYFRDGCCRPHPDDLGKVIGRGGRTATALRTLVAGIGGRGIRVDVVDTDQ